MPQDSSLGRELHPHRLSRALRQGSGCGHHATLGSLPGSPKGPDGSLSQVVSVAAQLIVVGKTKAGGCSSAPS